MIRSDVFRQKCVIIRKEYPSSHSCVLDIASEQIAASIRPGQFVNVLPVVPAQELQRATWEEGDLVRNRPSNMPLLRRPFSLFHYVPRNIVAKAETEKRGFSILFRVKGKGTQAIASLKVGEEVDVLGPLGKPYPLPEHHTQPVIIVAGGFGLAPMTAFADHLGLNDFPVYFLMGADNLADFPLLISRDEHHLSRLSPVAVSGFDTVRVSTALALRSGEEGAFKGDVLQLFDHFCKEYVISMERSPVIYTCGPVPMMKGVVERALAKQWEVHVSLENYMACGVGACMSCVSKIRKGPHSKEYQFLRTCTDGPSFRGEEVIWD